MNPETKRAISTAVYHRQVARLGASALAKLIRKRAGRTGRPGKAVSW